MKNIKNIIFGIFVLLSMGGFAQNKKILPENLSKDDSLTVITIALYPESTRKNILTACTYPDVLVNIELLQQKTRSEFKSELEKYPKETQIKVWNLSRYPGLVDKITTGEKKSKDELKKIAAEYPEDIHNTILESGKKDFDILERVNQLQKKADMDFEKLIAEYPENAKKSFREIVKYPEVLNILTEGMRMTVVLGGIHKKNEEGLNTLLDSISTAHATQNARDFEEWKAGLEKNPEAKKEMEDAAKQFADDEGYKEKDLIVRDEQVVVNYVVYPYPYWMGYPWWYSYAYWYPYPYWYDWGFYYTPYGIVYFGFPSAYYSYWYFYHHHHHYYYNHFTDYCLGYHYGHRKSRTEFNHNIDHWISENEKGLPSGYFTEVTNRPARIKEFGKFSIEYPETVKRGANSKLSKEEFLQNNAASYPNLNPQGSKSQGKDQKPVYTEPSKNYDPVYTEPSRTQPKIKIPKKPEPVQPRIEPKPKYEQPKITPKFKPRK